MSDDKIRPRLGRGLAALLGDVADEDTAIERARGLVSLGADAAMLVPVGFGDTVPKNRKGPLAAENRRVEIGRATPP